MGRHIDAANSGRDAFRPNPFEFAEIMYNWNPRADPDAVLDFPASDAFSVVPLHVAANSNNLIDFTTNEAWRYRKLTGYVASIFVLVTSAGFNIFEFRLRCDQFLATKPHRETRKPHTGWKLRPIYPM